MIRAGILTFQWRSVSSCRRSTCCLYCLLGVNRRARTTESVSSWEEAPESAETRLSCGLSTVRTFRYFHSFQFPGKQPQPRVDLLLDLTHNNRNNQHLDWIRFDRYVGGTIGRLDSKERYSFGPQPKRVASRDCFPALRRTRSISIPTIDHIYSRPS